MAKYVLQASPVKAANRSSTKLNDAQVLAEIEVGAYSTKPLSISAKPNLIYQLVDPATGAVVKGQKIYSKGRNLQVEVDGTTVVELTDFFVSKTEATEPTQQEAASTTATTESPSNLQDASAFDCKYAVIHSQTTKGSASEVRSMLWQPGQSATDCLNLAWAAVPETTEVGALAAVLGISGPVSAVTAGVVTAAAVSGSGSGGTAGLAAATIKGGIYAGSVISTGNGDLTVEAFDSSGKSLGSTKVASDGTYSLTLNSSYRGAVVVKAYDINTVNKTDPQYMDEATLSATTLPTLMAVANVTDVLLTVNITVLTNIAALQAGASTGVSTVVPDASSIEAANTAVSNLYLSGIDVLTSSVIPSVNTDGSVNTSTNAYGAALSVLSWFESEQGLSSSQAAAELNTSITTNSSGSMVLGGVVKTQFIEAIYSAYTNGQITYSQAKTLLGSSAGLTSFPAVIGGTTSAALTESSEVQSTTGTLTSTDVDGTNNLFVAQTDVAGGNGYGKFSITTAGFWKYTMNTAHDEFVGGNTYTDTATVSTADGTTQVLTVTMTGANDTPVVAPSAISLVDTATADTFANVTGSLSATDAEGTTLTYGLTGGTSGSYTVNSVAYDLQKVGTYGTLYAKASSGAYVFVANPTAINALGSGSTPSESFTVSVSDGTLTGANTLVVNLTGVNDTPVVSSVGTISLVDTAAADTFANVTGTLSASDAEGATLTYGLTGATSGSYTVDSVAYDLQKVDSYGTLYVKASSGAYVFVANATATNALGSGSTPSESFTVSASDGTLTGTNILVVNLTGVNDAPTLSTFSAAIGSVSQDTLTTITFDSLKSKGDEQDVDSEVMAFVVKALSSGTLLIGTSANTATAWVAGANDTIDANHFAFWQPDSGALGTLNAFTVVAKDASLESSTPVQVVMTVTDNVAPTATLDSSGSFNNSSSVSVQSSETGVAYLVNNTDTVTNVNDFSSLDGSHWNSQAITTADTDVSLSLADLVDGTYTLYTADAAGNLSAATGQVTLDSTAPVASFASDSDTGAHSINDSINVQSTEVGTAYLVQDGHTVSSLSDILNLSNVYYNSASVSSASTDTQLSLSDLDSGTYHLYTVDATGNLSAQSSASVVIPAVTITSAFVDATVTNFDVRSDIVFTSSEAVTAVTGKYIHIINDANTTTAKNGFNTESTAHYFDILVTDSSQVTVNGNTITLNLSDDLDLSNNYHITIDDGAFIGQSSGISSTAISSVTAMDFSTVTPGTGGTTSGSYLDISAVAALSKKMDSTGVLVDSYQWFDLESSNTNSDSATKFKYIDMTKGTYALVAKDYNSEAGSSADGTDGIKTGNFYIAAENFSINDLLYIDNQQNNNNIMDNAYINSFQPTDSYNRFEFSSVAGNGSNKGYIALKVLSLSDPGNIGETSNYFDTKYYLDAALALSTNSIISA